MNREDKYSAGHDRTPSTSKRFESGGETLSSRSSSRSKNSSSPIAIAGDDDQRIQLKLTSPVGGEPLVFHWPLREITGYSEGQEILEVVRSVLSSFPELNFIVRQHCGLNIDTVDKRDLKQMTSILDAFNKTCPAITQLWKGATKPGGEIWSAERADPVLLRQICTRAYNRAVDNVHLLNNHYKAFSSQTYGETSFDRMQTIIQEITPKERDVFVDLGSGVGQLVIHMAGGSKVKKAVGIEIAPLPNRYAQNLSTEFKKWMKWYGKKFRPFELHKGDFLDEKFRDLIIKEATIILVNNYAFTADLETRIKRELLSELKDGTRIISTKPYGLPNRTMTDRHLNDISAILDVYEMSQCENACSWTSNYVAYYHHTINHAKLEKYFLNQRNPSLKISGSDGSRRSSTSSGKTSCSSSQWSRESSASLPNSSTASALLQSRISIPSAGRETPPSSRNKHQRTNSIISEDFADEDNDDYTSLYRTGPTTRRQWQEYCSTKTKLQRTATPASSENNSSGRSVKWPTPDYEYAPSQKIRKVGQRGRPRKFSVTKSTEDKTKEAIDLMHEMTRTATTRPASPVHDASLVVTNVTVPSSVNTETSTVNSVTTESSSINASSSSTETIYHESKYPALNQMFESLRIMFETALERTHTLKFLEQVKEDIELQKSYNLLLRTRFEAMSKQVLQLRTSGLSNFYARLDELGIDANSPAALLENAKEIVAHHKKITAECAALESEITALEMSNHQLETKVRRRTEVEASGQNVLNNLLSANGNTNQLLNSLCATNPLLMAENLQAVASHNKNLLSRVTHLSEKADTNGMDNARGSSLHEGRLSPVSESGNMGFGYQVTSSTSTNSAHKRPRQRQFRPVLSTKKSPSRTVKHSHDPKQDEELERKIKDIVEKALKVDSAAKCAEKERRARGEKRKERGLSVRAIADSGSTKPIKTSVVGQTTDRLFGMQDDSSTKVAEIDW